MAARSPSRHCPRAGEVSEKLHLLFQQTQGEQAFALPARNLTFRAVSYPALPERNITAPVFLVEAYRGADPCARVR